MDAKRLLMMELMQAKTHASTASRGVKHVDGGLELSPSGDAEGAQRRGSFEQRVSGMQLITRKKMVDGRVVTQEDSTIFLPLPVGDFHRWWQPLMIPVLLLCLTVTPLQLAFMRTPLKPDHVLERLNICLDAVLMVDVAITFNTAVYANDMLVFKRSVIASRYLKGWFWIDFLSSIPITHLLNWIGGGSVSSTMAATRLPRLLRLLKFSRTVKMLRVMQQMEEMDKWNSGLSVWAMSFRFTKLLILVLMMAHISACVFAMLAGHLPASLPRSRGRAAGLDARESRRRRPRSLSLDGSMDLNPESRDGALRSRVDSRWLRLPRVRPRGERGRLQGLAPEYVGVALLWRERRRADAGRRLRRRRRRRRALPDGRAALRRLHVLGDHDLDDRRVRGRASDLERGTVGVAAHVTRRSEVTRSKRTLA